VPVSAVIAAFALSVSKALLCDQQLGSSSVKFDGRDHPPLPFVTEVDTGLPDLGSVWKPGQFASLGLAPSLALVGSGPMFLGVSCDCYSGADALGERLRRSFPVMSDGVLVYPSESKSVFRYSLKP
jgi:hypothetical protein